MTLNELKLAVQELVMRAQQMPSSRELAVAITNLQTGYLWIDYRIVVEERSSDDTILR